MKLKDKIIKINKYWLTMILSVKDEFPDIHKEMLKNQIKELQELLEKNGNF